MSILGNGDKRQVPDFVRRWAKRKRVALRELTWEIPGSAEWDKVCEELVGEGKYSNDNAVVYEYVGRGKDSGRCILLITHSLPYGIEGYGMEPEDEDIEEVFPVEVTVTKYLTKQQIEEREKGATP
jgi:hypothetical protein